MRCMTPIALCRFDDLSGHLHAATCAVGREWRFGICRRFQSSIASRTQLARLRRTSSPEDRVRIPGAADGGVLMSLTPDVVATKVRPSQHGRPPSPVTVPQLLDSTCFSIIRVDYKPECLPSPAEPYTGSYMQPSAARNLRMNHPARASFAARCRLDFYNRLVLGVGQIACVRR